MIDKNRSREIRRDIRNVLLDLWDPIGVHDAPEAQDEYDGCIGGVYALLTAGATAAQVIDHLWSIEKERMGLHCKEKALLDPVAQALLRINVRP
jgi:hypothetical protein